MSRRCILTYAGDRLAFAIGDKEGRTEFATVASGSDREEALEDVLATLQPLMAGPQADQQIRTAIEAEAAELSINACLLLGKHGEARVLADLLATYRPVPPVLASLALQGIITPLPDLPDRLREDHPDSLAVQLQAIMVEGELLDRPQPAYDAAVNLLSSASGVEEQREVLIVLNELAQRLGADALKRVSQIAGLHLPQDDRLRTLFRGHSLLIEGRATEAKAVLDTVRDENDPHWLQLNAAVLFASGSADQAVDSLLKAAYQAQAPQLLCRAAVAARDHGRPAEAAAALERSLELNPWDNSARRQLAYIYADVGDFGRATPHFEVLAGREPENAVLRFNYAVSLLRTGDLGASLAVLEPLCDSPDASLETRLTRAEVLKALGRAREAFDSLIPWRDAFWDDPNYLGVILDLSFIVMEEATGHEAMLRLRELQQQGITAHEIITEHPIEDVVALLRSAAERNEAIYQLVLKGRFPWLFADEALGFGSYLGWRIRTQPLSWVGDDPLNRARFSIYSTNGFGVLQQGSTSRLRELQCPVAGTAVVADLSSLITLHRLGLLDAAARYFGQLVIPSLYMARVVEQAGRLVRGQGTQEVATEAVDAALASGRIGLSAVSGADENSRIVEEYVDDPPSHRYRLVDLVGALHREGYLDDERRNQLLRAGHRPSGADEEHGALRVGDSITIGLTTLKTLHERGLFEEVLDRFAVTLETADRDRVQAELREMRTRREVHGWFADLCEQLRVREEFVQGVAVAGPDEAWVTEDPHLHLSLGAALLAQESGLPLLADDRASQSWALHHRPDADDAAFGTDRLLNALSQENLISPDAVADAFLQLVRWRYRFVVLPAEVLITLAARFLSYPPGNQLREVARYVHDCMRDAGLFGGMEPTSPPMSMAQCVFKLWTQRVAAFIAGVHDDTRFDNATAAALTRWAIEELLPSPPRVLGPRAVDLVESTGTFLLRCALLYTATAQNSERANAALRGISDALGLSSDQYQRIVSEGLNAR